MRRLPSFNLSVTEGHDHDHDRAGKAAKTDHEHANDHEHAAVSEEGLRDLAELLDDKTTSATTKTTTKDTTTTNANLPSEHDDNAKFYTPNCIRLNDVRKAAGKHLCDCTQCARPHLSFNLSATLCARSLE